MFQTLFIQGKKEEVAANVEALKQGRSMLDFVGDQSRRLNRTLSNADRGRPGPVTPLSVNWSAGFTPPKSGSTGPSRR
ncbi:MAG: DUF1552 domain-containing protein [Gemmataceae bacterium]